MASTYSDLKIQLMTTGENDTTWGTVTNTNLGTAIEEAISGTADVTFASANVTLTLINSNASQTARNMRLNLVGTTGGSPRDLVVPAIEKMYVVNNGCGDAVTVKVAGQTGVTVPAGRSMLLFNDGVDVKNALAGISVASGGTGTNTLTANAVILGNGTSTVQSVSPGTSGNVLTSNGSTWISQAVPALGTMSTQDANNVSITGGNVTGITNLSGTNITGTNLSGSGVNVTSINASNLASGTVPAARLPAATQTTFGAVKAYAVGSTLYITTT